MTTSADFQARWQRFKELVLPGDVLHGRVWRRSASWWLVDIGAPFLANLDDIDSDPNVELREGTEVEVVVKHHQDRKMMPFVSSRAELLTRARRQIELPTELRGEVVWPPPVEERQSE